MYAERRYSQQSINYDSFYHFKETFKNCVVNGGVGYLATLALEVSPIALNATPLHGAIFCVLATIVDKIACKLFENIRPIERRGLRIALKVVRLLLTAAVSIPLVALLGFPLSSSSALLIGLATIVSVFVLGKALKKSKDAFLGCFSEYDRRVRTSNIDLRKKYK